MDFLLLLFFLPDFDYLDQDDENGRLIEEEAALTGRVKWGVYYDYAKSIGLTGALVVTLFYALGQALHSLSNVSFDFFVVVVLSTNCHLNAYEFLKG